MSRQNCDPRSIIEINIKNKNLVMTSKMNNDIWKLNFVVKFKNNNKIFDVNTENVDYILIKFDDLYFQIKSGNQILNQK